MPIHLFGCVCVLMAGQEQREGEALSEKISNFHMLVLFVGKKSFKPQVHTVTLCI